MKYTNRWYTETGKRKRISKEFEPFREFIEANKNAMLNQQWLSLTIKIRQTYKLDLPEAIGLLIALIGMYDNSNIPYLGNIFRQENYERGLQVISDLKLN